jgi:diacylglycerol kinase family enzyme
LEVTGTPTPPQRPAVARRLAAAAALTALVTSVALGVLLVLNVQWLIVLLLLVVVVALSIWYALTRRGPLRMVAAATAVLGVLAVVTLGIPLFAFVFVPLLVFALAGRYALARDTQILITGVRPTYEVTPAGRGVLLINPKSGGGKAARFDLSGHAQRRGVRPVVLQPGDDIVLLAEQAVTDGADVIGVAGGDGSQALVAAVAMRHEIPYVCVPAGTRNHFALDLGLDRNDVIAALDAFTDGVERRIDLGQVNGRVFVNNVSLGVYGRVVQASGYREAKLQTWAQMLPDLIGPRAARFEVEFDGPKDTRFVAPALVLISNNQYKITTFRGLATRPRLDAGHLGIVAATIDNAVTELLSLAIARRSRHPRNLVSWIQPSFEVQAATGVPVGVDGESIILDPPLRFVSLRGALRVRLPRTATGASYPGAGAGLTRADLGALLRLALGRPIKS